MGVSLYFHLLGASHTSLAEPFSFAYIQVTSYLMNALTYFVHWSIPLFLFLTDIPHGKSINHCNLPPFFSILADLPSVGTPSPLEYLPYFQFCFAELRIPYRVPPFSFLAVFFRVCPHLFLAILKRLPHFGKESSLFVPSFLLFRRLPISAFSLLPYPYGRLPISLGW